MANPYVALRNLLNPAQPLWVGTVTAIHADGTSTVALPGGGEIKVRGTTVAVGAKAFVQAGEVRGEAPSLDSETMILY